MKIAKRIDEALDWWNQLYAAKRKHMQETYQLKQRIKSLEDQLQSAQACKYSNCTWQLVALVFRVVEVFVPCIGPSSEHERLVAAAK